MREKGETILFGEVEEGDKLSHKSYEHAVIEVKRKKPEAQYIFIQAKGSIVLGMGMYKAEFDKKQFKLA